VPAIGGVAMGLLTLLAFVIIPDKGGAGFLAVPFMLPALYVCMFLKIQVTLPIVAQTFSVITNMVLVWIFLFVLIQMFNLLLRRISRTRI
jgi:hypothetical protein